MTMLYESEDVMVAKVLKLQNQSNIMVFNMTWQETNTPGTWGLVIVDKAFNLNNYKSDSTKVMKIANVLSLGGTVTVQYRNGATNIRVNDSELIEHFMLEQAEYCINHGYKMYGKLGRFMKSLFANRVEAAKFFKSTGWLEEMEEYKFAKYNLVDLLLPVLMEAQEDYLLNRLNKESDKRVAQLRTEYYKLGINKKYFMGELPSCEVTTPTTAAPEVTQEFGEDGPYISYAGKDIITKADEVEAKLVQTWLFQNGFSSPSLEEQMEELESLRDWFKELKAQAVPGFTVQPEMVDKYVRLEELEAEVGFYLAPVLDPDWIATSDEEPLQFFYDAVEGSIE
jgi:hypothetical protein